MKNEELLKKPSAFARHVGIGLHEGGRLFRMKVRLCHANAMGYAHGGAIFTLADCAFARAVNSKGRTAVAMEMKINYLLPVKVGDVLEARARIIKAGRKTAVCIVEVRCKKDLVAIVLATAFNISNIDP